MLSRKYQSAVETTMGFMAKIEDLVKEIAVQNKLPYYRIESNMEHNAHGAEVPVIRVITYFEDTVAHVADLLRQEFEMTALAAQDKNKDSLDSFSYKHLQYTAALKDNRRNLVEYKEHAGTQFELQLCSMLQDAWTGIEKELGYTEHTFSEATKRDFYRVGALLGMADMEFIKLRNAAGKHTATPQATATPKTTVHEVPAPQAVIHHVTVPATAEKHEPATPGLAPQRVPLTTDEHATAMNISKQEAPAAAHVHEAATHHAAELTNTVEVTPEATQHIPAAVQANHTEQIISAMIPGLSLGPKAEQVIPEIAAQAPPVIPEVTAKADHATADMQNAANEASARAAEVMREQKQQPTTHTPHFFEDQPKPAKVVALDENAPMTDASLKEYVMNSKILKEVDSRIAERAGAKINADIDIEGDVERLRFLKVFTLKQLADRIADNKNDIVLFAEKWIGKDNGGSFDSGISLFYLEYLLVGKKNDPAFAIEYVVKFISDNDYSARYIIPTYNSIKSSGDSSSNFAHLTLRA